MEYAKFIRGNEGFQSAINIQYDLANNYHNKIKGYIPTVNSVELLKEYLMNVLIDDRDKATVLIGPYGKGKSHLLLVLLGLLAGNEESKELKGLIEKIEKVDPTTSKLADDVLCKKKYMPITINFNSGDLSQAFLIAINQALKTYGIEDILPETYFGSALNILEGWEKYESTMENVKEILKNDYDKSLEGLKTDLKLYDDESYQIFKNIFKVVTSGIEFNPLLNTDVVKLYEETNHILNEKYNFDGMIIIFDEFSKFIEASVSSNNAMNMKILQDFAELSNRSQKPQMHLVCVTHKTINEYISKIPQEKIDGWRAIEGRFKEVFFNTSSQQNYELIGNAIIKDAKQVKKVLDEKGLYKSTAVRSASTLFGYNDEEYKKNIVEGCFPLSPYSTYTLPIISEKVAQNERTLFTYLSKDEPNSLINLIGQNNHEFELVDVDKIYDYFEGLISKETFNESIHQIWLKVDTALKIVYSENSKRVIKALGIIYIINDFNTLPATEHVIANMLNMNMKEVSEIISELRSLNILILRKSSDTLDFIPLSSVNVNEKVKNLMETKYKLVSIDDTYNELMKLKYILPKKYNDEYKITRFFKRCFMTIDKLEAYSSSEKLLSSMSTDGIIIDLIYTDKSECRRAEKWLKDIDDNRIILIIPREECKIQSNLSEYKALVHLRNDEEFLKEDLALESQIDILLDDIIQKIDNYIEESYEISSENNYILINGTKYSEMKQNKLSKMLTEICEENYKNTPIINNELVNKQEVSSPIRKARNTIIDMLLDDSYKDFEYNNNAVESTLFRSTLVNKGLATAEKAADEDMKLLLDIIKAFILDSSNKEKNFEELYKLLLTNEKKIGMRKGALPIYIAYVLKDFRDEAIIYIKSGRSKKEIIIDSSIIENINNNPKDYAIKLEPGTDDKEKYTEDLLDLFSEYSSKKITNRYVELVSRMKKWMQSLSLYAQNHRVNINNEAIAEEIVWLRNDLVKFEINYRSFIFTQIPKYLKVTSYTECFEKIKEIKHYLDNHDEEVKAYLINETKKLFDCKYKGSLTANLNKWYKELSTDQKEHLYNAETNSLLKIIDKSGNDDIELIEKLSYVYTNLTVEDWNDNSIEIFLAGINKSKNDVEEYVADIENKDGLIKIVFESSTEGIVEKSFSKTEISPMGSTLFNTIEDAFEEYGDAIDDNEKRNILIDILTRYI